MRTHVRVSFMGTIFEQPILDKSVELNYIGIRSCSAGFVKCSDVILITKLITALTNV